MRSKNDVNIDNLNFSSRLAYSQQLLARRWLSVVMSFFPLNVCSVTGWHKPGSVERCRACRQWYRHHVPVDINWVRAHPVTRIPDEPEWSHHQRRQDPAARTSKLFPAGAGRRRRCRHLRIDNQNSGARRRRKIRMSRSECSSITIDMVRGYRRHRYVHFFPCFILSRVSNAMTGEHCLRNWALTCQACLYWHLFDYLTKITTKTFICCCSVDEIFKVAFTALVLTTDDALAVKHSIPFEYLFAIHRPIWVWRSL